MGSEAGSAPSGDVDPDDALPRYLRRTNRSRSGRLRAAGRRTHDHVWAALGCCATPAAVLVVGVLVLSSITFKACDFSRNSCLDTRNGLLKPAIDGDTQALDSDLSEASSQADLNVGLVCAASYGEPGSVDRLLRAGADPNATPRQLGPPLVAAVPGNGEASGFGHHSPQRLEVVELLLAAHADPVPALSPAAEASSADIVAALIFAGASVNGATSETSPLATAVFFKNDEVVTRLLALGADANAGGFTDGAVLSFRLLVVPCLRGSDRQPGLDTLDCLPAGPAAWATTSPRSTGSVAPPTTASPSPSPSSTAPVPPAVQISGSGEVTPLGTAVLIRRAAVISQLLAAGADPDKASLGRYTPLWLAVDFHDVDTALTLLQAGARTDPPPGSGVESPLALARSSGQTNLVDLLSLFLPH